tara:strand:- start:3113 stop:4618 length:1506 start_codon:yes stop_codon:yes gene_type:complete
VTPRITSVTVFSRGAEISRTENIKIKSGIDTITLTGLSPYLKDQTIQAKINGAQILNMKYGINYLKKKKDEPKLAKIKGQIKTIESDILDLNDQLSYLEVEYDLILSNKKISTEEIIDVEDVKDFVDYFQSKIPDLIAKITDSKEQIKKFKKVKDLLKKQESELQKVNSKKTGELEILYRSIQNRQSSIELSYYVSRCGWSPLYNMRASNIGDPIQFEYNAEIYQNTGVNWTNCNLTIATGNPILEGNKPELYSWSIGEHDYSNTLNNVVENENLKLEGTYYKKDVRKNRVNKPIITENLTFTSFKIPQKLSINSEEGEKGVTILKRKLPADYQYFAVPKKSNGVFLIAQVTEWEKLPLIPGKSHIYFDNTFIGKSYIKPNIMNDTLEVSLGQDQNILINRKKQENKCLNKTTILGATKTRGYEINIKNNRNKTIKIQIMDQIPISKSNRIKITSKLGEGWSLDEDTGLLEWVLEIPSGDKKSSTFEFEIKHPKKLNIPIL